VDPQRQSHQWRYFSLHLPLQVSGHHSPHWSSARSASHHPQHPDYTRPISHLPTTLTGTWLARYRQSRVRRHGAWRYCSLFWEFLVLCTTHLAQGGQRLAFLQRLLSIQLLNHSRLPSHSPHTWLLPPAVWLLFLIQDRPGEGLQPDSRSPSDIQNTTITTRFGLFDFPFMSFGLCNAAQTTFQRFMDNDLRGLDFCFDYLDDILVFSRLLEEHERHLRALFNHLQTYGNLISPARCVFWASEVTFLSYKVSAEGFWPLEEWVAHLHVFTTAPFLRPSVSSVTSWAC
jgi:hypothetical protein